jgi:hypothetical protein
MVLVPAAAVPLLPATMPATSAGVMMLIRNGRRRRQHGSY